MPVKHSPEAQRALGGLTWTRDLEAIPIPPIDADVKHVAISIESTLSVLAMILGFTIDEDGFVSFEPPRRDSPWGGDVLTIVNYEAICVPDELDSRDCELSDELDEAFLRDLFRSITPWVLERYTDKPLPESVQRGLAYLNTLKDTPKTQALLALLFLCRSRFFASYFEDLSLRAPTKPFLGFFDKRYDGCVATLLMNTYLTRARLKPFLLLREAEGLVWEEVLREFCVTGNVDTVVPYLEAVARQLYRDRPANVLRS